MNEPIPFLQDANEAAQGLLSCFRQDLAFTASLCDRHGITEFPSHFDPVFRVLMEEWRAGRNYDWISIAKKLRANHATNGASADNIRPFLYEYIPIHGAELYASTLAKSQRALKLHKLGRELSERTLDPHADVDELRSYTERALATIQTPAADGQKSGLSFRTPEELVGMEFDDSDIILENRIMAIGQSLVMAAAAGIGKSRMLLQLAACVVTGRPFLGMNVASSGWPWLIFQTENSNRRLNFDLHKIRRWLGEGDFHKFNQRCMIHTLEHDADSLLNIESGAAMDAMQAAIKQHPSQIVVFDPLNAFTTGNLNADQDMRAVISALSRLTREGMSDRVPFFLHHALTGAGGAAKATGFERSSFARNSKTLLAWTRAQINIAPASADDNTRLVVACGKNSNGKEFAPFGIVLDEETMIYDVDPDFDLDQWQEEVAGKGKGREPDTGPEDILRVLREMKEASDRDWQRECKESLCISPATFYRHKKKAMKDGTIVRSKMTKLWMPK